MSIDNHPEVRLVLPGEPHQSHWVISVSNGKSYQILHLPDLTPETLASIVIQTVNGMNDLEHRGDTLQRHCNSQGES